MPFHSACSSFYFLLQLTNSKMHSICTSFMNIKQVSSSLNVCDVHASFLFVFLLSFVCVSSRYDDNQKNSKEQQRNDELFALNCHGKFFHYAACRRLFELECCFIFFHLKERQKRKAESKEDNLHNDIVCFFSRLSENCYSWLCS
jgi:hypothetical protein